MVIETSQKILLLTKNKTIHHPIHNALTQEKLESAENYLNLTSLSVIQRAIEKTKNTTFIRTELLRFIRENGFPRFIAMDYKIDTGLDTMYDPDHMKILRTFLISFIILTRGKGFENLQGNIILFFKEDEDKYITHFERNPEKILDLLKTKDETVNSFIHELKTDLKKFNKLFLIKCISFTEQPQAITNEIINYINAIKIRDKLRYTSPKSVSVDRIDIPADIIYKTQNGTLFINNSMTEEINKYEDIPAEIIFIKGAWTNKTLMDVAQRLVAFITTEKDDVNFAPNDEIILNMGEDCIVDGTTTTYLIQTLSRELSGFTNLHIKISEKNYSILEQTKGFTLIKKYLNIQ